MEDINLFKKENSIYLKEIRTKSEIKDSDDCDGYFLKTSEKEARRIIDSLKNKKKIIAIEGSPEINRRAIETLKINYLINPQSGTRKDSLKQRDSGLNNYLAKEAKRKKIKIVIGLDFIKNTEKKEKSRIISRIIQNIKICRKAGCEIKIASLGTNEKETYDKKQRQSIGYSWGMDSKQVKKCCEFNQ